MVLRKLISLKFVALLILVFVGQVTASTAISCEMTKLDQPQMSEHAGHDMSQHDSHSSSQTLNDCCDPSKSCSMSGCIAFALASDFDTYELALFAETIVSNHKNIPSQTSSSLYRPPILS